MKTSIVYIILLLSFLNCKAQNKIIVRYISHHYSETKNKSFMNDVLVFLENGDTLRVNVKTPFDAANSKIINRGIYYNCHLKKDSIYTIKLKKICGNDIQDLVNNYYKTNTLPDKMDCSKFVEIKKDTKYDYSGNYGKYVDINNTLYQIIDITPSSECFFSH